MRKSLAHLANHARLKGARPMRRSALRTSQMVSDHDAVSGFGLDARVVIPDFVMEVW